MERWPMHCTEPFAHSEFRTRVIESFLARIEGPDFGREIGRVASHDRQVVKQCRRGQQGVDHRPATALSFVSSAQLPPSLQNFAAQWQQAVVERLLHFRDPSQNTFSLWAHWQEERSFGQFTDRQFSNRRAGFVLNQVSVRRNAFLVAVVS